MIFKKYKITSKFGPRILNGNDTRHHDGIDLVGLSGNIDIISPIEGKVIQSRIITDTSNLTSQWGHYITIKATDGSTHYFCHLKTRLVKLGDEVKIGQIIGVMGNTGYSYGAHTHYGIKNTNNKWIDPLKYFHLENLQENTIYTLEDNMEELKKSIELLTERVNVLEKHTKRYSSLSDLPAYYQTEIKKAVDRGTIKGNPDGTIDLTMDMIRNIIIEMRDVDQAIAKIK